MGESRGRVEQNSTLSADRTLLEPCHSGRRSPRAPAPRRRVAGQKRRSIPPWRWPRATEVTRGIRYAEDSARPCIMPPRHRAGPVLDDAVVFRDARDEQAHRTSRPRTHHTIAERTNLLSRTLVRGGRAGEPGGGFAVGAENPNLAPRARATSEIPPHKALRWLAEVFAASTTAAVPLATRSRRKWCGSPRSLAYERRTRTISRARPGAVPRASNGRGDLHPASSEESLRPRSKPPRPRASAGHEHMRKISLEVTKAIARSPRRTRVRTHSARGARGRHPEARRTGTAARHVTPAAESILRGAAPPAAPGRTSAAASQSAHAIREPFAHDHSRHEGLLERRARLEYQHGPPRDAPTMRADRTGELERPLHALHDDRRADTAKQIAGDSGHRDPRRRRSPPRSLRRSVMSGGHAKGVRKRRRPPTTFTMRRRDSPCCRDNARSRACERTSGRDDRRCGSLVICALQAASPALLRDRSLEDLLYYDYGKLYLLGDIWRIPRALTFVYRLYYR